MQRFRAGSMSKPLLQRRGKRVVLTALRAVPNRMRKVTSVLDPVIHVRRTAENTLFLLNPCTNALFLQCYST
jgi:hypothetical protein